MWLLKLIILSLLWKGIICQLPGYAVDVETPVTVQQGLCIIIPCNFTYPDTQKAADNSRGFWYRESDASQPVASKNAAAVSDETRAHFQLLGDLQKNSCSLSISDVKKAAKGKYFFRYEDRVTSGFKFSYVNYLLKVEVKDLSDKPVISSTRKLIEGEEVVLNCTAPGNCSGTPPQITWMTRLHLLHAEIRSSVNYTDGTQTHISMIFFNASRSDHNTSLTCNSYYPAVNAATSETVQLNIEYRPNIDIAITDQGGTKRTDNSSSVVIQEGANRTLVCTADSNPLANLTWMKGENILKRSNLHNPENKLEWSLWRITPGDGGTYRCAAVNEHGERHGSITVTVEYPPRTPKIYIMEGKTTDSSSQRESNSPEVILNGTTLNILCSVDSSPLANLTWIKGGDRIINESNIARQKSLTLSLPNIMPEQEGEYFCEAKNQHGMARASLNISVEYPPKLADGYNSSCQKEGNLMICVCEIQANPLPKIQWEINDNTLPEGFQNKTLYQSSSLNGNTNNSTLTMNVSVHAVLKVVCRFSNKHGNGDHILHVSDVLAPENHLMPLIVGAVAGACVMAAMCMVGWLLIRSVRRKTNDNKSANDKEEMVDDINLIYSEIQKLPKGSTADQGDDDKPPSSANISELKEDLYENFGEDNLQYASIDFSKAKPRSNPRPLQEDTLYSEVKLQ